MKNRAAYRTEVKTRLTDTVYDRLQLFKQVHGIESDSAALARLIEMGLFGVLYGVLSLEQPHQERQ
jgi:hypothetical protein